jgi:peptidoglycan/LPS O-acetylase OafA/YrhL
MIDNKNFDNIRFIAVIAVLAIHTTLPNIFFNLYGKNIENFNYRIYFSQSLSSALYYNFFKIGTNLFFIISGFLFEMQSSNRVSFKAFFNKKVKSLLWPYLIIFLIPTFIIIGLLEPNFGVKENINLDIFAKRVLGNMFLTNFWFIPALFITLLLNYFISTKNLFKSLFIITPIGCIPNFRRLKISKFM